MKRRHLSEELDGTRSPGKEPVWNAPSRRSGKPSVASTVRRVGSDVEAVCGLLTPSFGQGGAGILLELEGHAGGAIGRWRAPSHSMQLGAALHPVRPRRS
jgi:hypothetical protein